MTIRVVHWGVGATGRLGLQGVLGHPDLELVGLIVQRPENAGKDAGELCDRSRTGVIATGSVDEMLALKPECLAYFGAGVNDPQTGLENVARFLEAGVDVVTTSFSSLVHPEHGPAPLRSRLEAACRRGGASFFATGVEPGFASDILPMAVLSATDRVDALRVLEIADYSTNPADYGQRPTFGFGMPMDYEPVMFTGDLLTGVWGPVVRGMADAIGVKLDGLRQWHEFGATSRDLETAFGRIDAGTRSAFRFAVEGLLGGKPIVALEHVSFLSPETPAHWPRSALGKHAVYRIEITGRPSSTLELGYDFIQAEEHALIATAMRAINAIPSVVAAPPGPLGPHQVPARFSGHVRAPPPP
jgi:4-hydroxy-tetrahydrodipicolinate reductase